MRSPTDKECKERFLEFCAGVYDSPEFLVGNVYNEFVLDSYIGSICLDLSMISFCTVLSNDIYANKLEI